jgi:hypothetical protein
MIESVVHMFTGGDDNAVHLVELAVTSEVTCKLLASVLDAHASTVTGVLSLGEAKFLSVGIDQNMRFWKFDGASLRCLCKAYTFVPDVGGIVEIDVEIGVQEREKRSFVVFGTGMELISWEDGE